MGLTKANSTSFKPGNIPWSKGRRIESLVGNKHGVTHGMSGTTIYRVWIRMKQRCNNPNDPAFKWYGERGIKVSSEWEKFENFYRDMGNKPTPKHTLERVDNNGNYCKENCVWATMDVQGKNRRDNVLITFNGKTQNISDWAREIGIKHGSLSKRLKRWTLEEALTRPITTNAIRNKSNNKHR